MSAAIYSFPPLAYDMSPYGRGHNAANGRGDEQPLCPYLEGTQDAKRWNDGLVQGGEELSAFCALL